MRNRLSIYSAIVTGTLLSGCSHYYYLPNSPNIPLLTEKGDWRASVAGYQGGGGGSNIPGIEIQGSYAVGKKVGLMASVQAVNKSDGTDYGKGSYFDLGAGYYQTNKSKHLVFEVYGVMGVGHAENGFSNLATSKANFTKIYIQPIFGYKSKYFDAGITWRLASQHFSAIQFSGALDSFELDRLNAMQAQPNSFLSEPGFVLRAGVENFKIQMQVGYSYNTTRSYTIYNEVLGGGSIGIIVMMGRGKKK